MAQIKLVKDSVTHLLPHPQEYSEPRTLRAADTVTLNGLIHRDFVTGEAKRYCKITLVWEALTEAEIQVVRNAWRDLRTGGDTWIYTNPSGMMFLVKLDLSDPNLQVKMSPGSSGEIEYGATLNLIEA